MINNLFNKKTMVLVGIIFAAALTRLIPHYPNFTAIGAVALFGGAYFDKKYLSFVVPFAALFVTDLILGLHSTMWAVYLSFALIVVIGFNLRKQSKPLNIGVSAVAASVLFFLITNFAVWLSSPMYPPTTAGLVESYVAAIPFFNYTLFGNLFYVGVVFGIFELAKLKFPSLVKA